MNEAASNERTANLRHFLAALAAHCRTARGKDVEVAREIDRLLAAWPEAAAARMPDPLRLPACDHLDATLALGRAGDERHLLEMLAPLIAPLHWSYGYPADARWPDLAASIAFAQIVGPSGYQDEDKVQLGLTLMAPGTYYPMHAHPAIELYVVLAGSASWRVAGKPFSLQPPGAFILHPGGVGHAMQTHGEPLLALYFWRGDLTTWPSYVDEGDDR